jgi:glucokinase
MNARFVNLGLLNQCVQEMVKMSPLQGYVFEVVERSDEVAVLGAAINAMGADS